jgi:two-component system sensor histidine kinase KdpD
MNFAAREPALTWQLGRHGAALGIVGMATALGLPFGGELTSASLSMLYLLGVVFAGLNLGRGPAVLAAIASGLAFNFCFAEPRWTLRIHHPSDILTFVSLVTIGLVVAELAARMRAQAQLARLREIRAVAVSSLAEALLGAEDEAMVRDLAQHHIGAAFDAEIELLVGGHDGMLPDDVLPAARRVPFDASVVRWVVIEAQAAGCGTAAFVESALHYVPVRTPHRVLGVLIAAPRDTHSLLRDEPRAALANHARQIALALDRVRYAAHARAADVAAQLEQSRRALLAGLSHDLRTPLATLVGASSALLSREPVATGSSHELLQTIHEESQRMARLTDNLLDMARLVGGATAIKAEWIPIDELIGSARRQLRDLARERRIEVSIEASLSAACVDAVLFERVVVNLLENALKYSAPDAPVDIICRRADGRSDALLLGVLDRGPGLAEHTRRHAFDAFYRGTPEGPQSGVGLGLALSQAIVELHRGRIWVENRAGGGAAFWVSLPQPADGAPTLPAETEA